MTFPSSGASSSGGRFGGGERQYISGQAALIHTDGWTWEDMAVKPSAAVHLIFPSMGGRGGRGGGGPPDVAEAPGAAAAAAAAGATQARRAYDEQIAKLSQFFEDARNYQKAKAANMAGFRRDLKMESMLGVLEGKVPVAISASRATAIHDAIQFAEKQKVKMVLLQPVEIGKSAAELKEKNIPVILGRVLQLPENEDDPYDARHTLAAEAFKAGVRFAFGTFDNQFVRNLPYEAAAAVAFGLPYEEALKAITINPAQIWGVADQVGSVEKGKWADLILVTGDPLEIQTQVKYVFVKGRETELASKQTKLYDKYMSRP
jgi:imidazolonepropionase-like amidohydrolase